MREYMNIAGRNNVQLVLYCYCCKGRYSVNVHLKCLEKSGIWSWLESGYSVIIVCACVCVCHRIDSFASAVFLSLLDVLFAWPRHVASPLPAPVLQGQETDRVVYSRLLPLLDRATSSFVCQQQFWARVLLTCCWVFWCSLSTGNVQKQKIAPPGMMYKIEMKSVMLNEDIPLRPRTFSGVYRFNSTQSIFITVTDTLHSFSRGQNKKFEDMPRTNARGQGLYFEAESEAEDKILASRPACPWGLNITG